MVLRSLMVLALAWPAAGCKREREEFRDYCGGDYGENFTEADAFDLGPVLAGDDEREIIESQIGPNRPNWFLFTGISNGGNATPDARIALDDASSTELCIFGLACPDGSAPKQPGCGGQTQSATDERATGCCRPTGNQVSFPLSCESEEEMGNPMGAITDAEVLVSVGPTESCLGYTLTLTY